MRRALLAVTVFVAAFLAPGLAAPAGATTVSGACTTSKGVTVVVNFGTLGGGTQARCYSAATSSTTGVNALSGAGFHPEGTAKYALAFICRIAGKPGDPPEHCVDTPPATAYWSYWYASNGGSWAYSSKGAASRTVIVGGFEGWSFHSGSGSSTPPTSGSPTHPVTAPGPKPTIKLGPAASTSTTSSSHRLSSSSSSAQKPSASKTAATPGSPTTSPTSTSTGAGPLATSTSADSAGGALAAERPADGGSPWPLLGGISGISLILAGAVVVVRRRRGAGGF